MKFPLASVTIFSLVAAGPVLAAQDAVSGQPGASSTLSGEPPRSGLSGSTSGSSQVTDQAADAQARAQGEARSEPVGSASAKHQTRFQGDPGAGISPEQAQLNNMPGDERDALMSRPDAQSQIESLASSNFASFDTNGDSALIEAEVNGEPFVLETMTAYDIDRNGELSSDEFSQLQQGLQDELAARQQAAADRSDAQGSEPVNDFRNLDSNGDRILAGHELQRSSRLADEFDEADDNDDGFVSESEYVEFAQLSSRRMQHLIGK